MLEAKGEATTDDEKEDGKDGSVTKDINNS